MKYTILTNLRRYPSQSSHKNTLPELPGDTVFW